MNKTEKNAILSLILNVIFSAYHIIVGITTASLWLFTLGIYYTILSLIRFVALIISKNENLMAMLAGIMLLALSFPLAGTVVLSVVTDRGKSMNEIIMIAMAVYAFTRITIAIINVVKIKKGASAKLITLRNICLADALASIFSLQRSMLVTFDGMTPSEIQIMNLATGTAVCIFVFLLGLNMLRKGREAQSLDANSNNNEK